MDNNLSPAENTMEALSFYRHILENGEPSEIKGSELLLKISADREFFRDKELQKQFPNGESYFNHLISTDAAVEPEEVKDTGKQGVPGGIPLTFEAAVSRYQWEHQEQSKGVATLRCQELYPKLWTDHICLKQKEEGKASVQTETKLSFMDVVNQYASEHNLSMAQAVRAVSEENPDLHESYVNNLIDEAKAPKSEPMAKVEHTTEPFMEAVNQYSSEHNMSMAQAVRAVIHDQPELHDQYLETLSAS
ncbi:MAG: hypothetical protein ABIK92_13060 [Pseudomonadota bacterium]